MKNAFCDQLVLAWLLAYQIARRSAVLADRMSGDDKLSVAEQEKARDEYYEIEEAKGQLDELVYKLRQYVVEVSVDELGKKVCHRFTKREAWVNWIACVSRSAFLSLQELYPAFLIRHQDVLLSQQPWNMSDRFLRYHELKRNFSKREVPREIQVNAYLKGSYV